MGLFLALSGVAGSDPLEVEGSLREYAAGRGMILEPATSVTEERNALLIVASPDKNTTVMYPGEFMEWDEAAAHLSRTLKKPVFSFHIHDGDLWMYVLFVDGEEVDWFNPLPEYWDDSISDEERQRWSGNAELVCDFWPGVHVEEIKNYLVHRNLDELEDGRKAYPEDEHSIGEDWQLTDFMRKLGLTYPMDEKGTPTGKVYRFGKVR